MSAGIERCCARCTAPLAHGEPCPICAAKWWGPRQTFVGVGASLLFGAAMNDGYARLWCVVLGTLWGAAWLILRGLNALPGWRRWARDLLSSARPSQKVLTGEARLITEGTRRLVEITTADGARARVAVDDATLRDGIAGVPTGYAALDEQPMRVRVLARPDDIVEVIEDGNGYRAGKTVREVRGPALLIRQR